MKPEPWHIAPELAQYMRRIATKPTPYASALIVHRVSTGLPPQPKAKKSALFCPSEWFSDDE